jgi:hypothetical protein
MQTNMPPTWYYPIPGDSEHVIAKDYDPATGEYDLNRRIVRVSDIPTHFRTVIRAAFRAANAT